MKNIDKKIAKEYEAYESALKEGDVLIQEWNDAPSKEIQKKYKRVKRKEQGKLLRLIRMIAQHIKKNELDYIEFIKKYLKAIAKDGNKTNLWIIIQLITQKRPEEDISLELCEVCKQLLNRAEYDDNDEHYVEHIIGLLWLWKNPVQINLLKDIILKDPYYEFKVIGKAISFLKEIEDDEVESVLLELKESERYKEDEVFRRNVDDDVPADYWWMI